MGTIFIMPHEEGWAVKSDHSDHITSVHESREEAIETAKEVAMADDSGLVVLREDGTVDDFGDYGINPLPSEDSSPEFNPQGDEEV